MYVRNGSALLRDTGRISSTVLKQSIVFNNVTVFARRTMTSQLSPLPGVKAPWTEAMGSFNTYQHNPICRDFELRLADCVLAYGWHRSIEKCDLLFKDLNECIFSIKRTKRLELMHQERVRQKGRPYIEPSLLDLY